MKHITKTVQSFCLWLKWASEHIELLCSILQYSTEVDGNTVCSAGTLVQTCSVAWTHFMTNFPLRTLSVFCDYKKYFHITGLTPCWGTVGGNLRSRRRSRRQCSIVSSLCSAVIRSSWCCTSTTAQVQANFIYLDNFSKQFPFTHRHSLIWKLQRMPMLVPFQFCKSFHWIKQLW
jgi:hypothetical protein